MNILIPREVYKELNKDRRKLLKKINLDEYEGLEDDFGYDNEEDALRALDQEAEATEEQDEQNMDIVDKIMRRGEQQMIQEAQELA